MARSFATLLLLALSSTLIADGGAVRVSQQLGSDTITVFTSPTPLRAGPIDVSVLIQNSSTGEPLDKSPIEIRAVSQTPSPITLRQTATKEAATNKLLSAAKFDLPQSGPWRFEAIVGDPRDQYVLRFTADAAPPSPRWQSFWLWFAWPIVPIGLFLAARSTSRNRHVPIGQLSEPQAQPHES